MKFNNEYKSMDKCNENDVGVIFDKSLSFAIYIQSFINKANKMIGINRRTYFLR